jgi:hypothetical protein
MDFNVSELEVVAIEATNKTFNDIFGIKLDDDVTMDYYNLNRYSSDFRESNKKAICEIVDDMVLNTKMDFECFIKNR